jgi:antitoxin VapB
MTRRKARPAGMSRKEGARYVAKSMDRSPKLMLTAKLFKHGRSQAVRLPEEFRFEGDEVYARRMGTSIVLSPKEKPKENSWKDFFAALDMIDRRFSFIRDQPPQQVRRSLELAFPSSPRKARSK